MKRKIIHIDGEKCTGCARCLPNCPEGAIQMIDGKARLVGDLFCDGLGACLGECPENAITVEEREAEPYNEERVIDNIIPQGEKVIRAHLDHLIRHGETGLYKAAVIALAGKGIAVPDAAEAPSACRSQGCPGSRAIEFGNAVPAQESGAESTPGLAFWPIQLHLLPPRAPFLAGRDLVLCADCVAYAAPDFHRRLLEGRALAIACPKLDEGQEIYLEKLKALIGEAGIRSLEVLTMEVPCCAGLARLVERALEEAGRKDLKVSRKVISLKGEIIHESKIA